ncbi:MAG TPA: tetrathionate reductase, partial [Gemmobacter sp.]|nr:tetrathionate reductase [Gemmobacter sp.]
MTMIQPAPLPRFARLLGLSGLLPQMLCLALALADPGMAGLEAAGLAGLFYAALILSFLGGLWWMAAALGGMARPGPYLLAVLPSLAGWAILLAQALGLLALPACLALLALCLLAMVAVWAVAGWLGQGRSFQAALQLWQQFPVWRLSMLGSAVAGAALLWALVRGGQRMACPRYTLALGLGLAAAAWAFRWALFMGVQGVPKYGAGLYIYHMPLGGDGLL